MTIPRVPAVVLKGGQTYTVPKILELYRREKERLAKQPKAK